MRDINASQLRQYLNEAPAAPVLLDVREPWEFNLCAIEGSIHIPMGRIQHGARQLNSDQETVVICHHGIRSAQVGRFLEGVIGFSDVVNLSGGISAWARDVDPGMAVY